MIADARAVGERAAAPETRALARLASIVTEAPWALSAAELARARAAGLADDAILHAIALSAFFGHLNRVADAVGIELDYAVALEPPHAEPATPPYLAPDPAAWPEPGAGPLALASRPGAAAALDAWRAHALDREVPLRRSSRAVIARAVAERLGDAATVRALADAAPAGAVDACLVDLADVVTRAPWRLGEATLAPLRSAGVADDATLFDAIATAAACTVFSRLATALAALRA